MEPARLAAADDQVQQAASAVAPSTPPCETKLVLRLRLPPAWTSEEDAMLEHLAKQNGSRHWRRVAMQMPRRRTPGECRYRWRDHLARDIYHRPFTAADDAELACLCLRHDVGGDSRWKDISRAVDGRSSRAVKRRWRELRKSNEFLRKLWRPISPMLTSAGQYADQPSPSSGAVLVSTDVDVVASCTSQEFTFAV